MHARQTLSQLDTVLTQKASCETTMISHRSPLFNDRTERPRIAETLAIGRETGLGILEEGGVPAVSTRG